MLPNDAWVLIARHTPLHTFCFAMSKATAELCRHQPHTMDITFPTALTTAQITALVVPERPALNMTRALCDMSRKSPFLRCLPCATALEHLSLDGCDLDDCDIERLASVLPRLNVSTLTLVCNRFGEFGMKSLSSAILDHEAAHRRPLTTVRSAQPQCMIC